MSTAEEAAAAATLLRQRLTERPSVQLVDIGVDLDMSYFVRVWVLRRTPELMSAVPSQVNGVTVRVTTE